MDNPLIVKKGKIGELTRRVKVGFVGTCEKYYTNEKKYPMIRTTNLSETGINYEDLKYVTEEFYDKNKKSQLHDGDVLIARFGTSGTACVYHGGDAQCLNAIIVEPNCDNALPEYLAIVINSRRVREQINRRIVGSTQAILNTKVLSDIEIELPSLNEQKRICDILFSIRKTIAYRKDELAYFDELIKARFVEMFGDENNSKNWDLVRIEEVADVQVGVVIKPAQYYTDKDNGIKAFRSLNVGEGYIKDSDWVYFSQEGHLKNSKSILKENDLLIVRSGAPGTACVVPKEYAGCNAIDIIIAHPDCERVNSHYLCAFTNMPHGKRQIDEGTGGAAQQHFNVGKYNKMVLMLPPLKLQDDFEDYIKQVDKSKSVVQKSLDEAQLLFDSLMQEYFG